MCCLLGVSLLETEIQRGSEMTSNKFLPWQTCVKYCNIFVVELVLITPQMT